MRPAKFKFLPALLLSGVVAAASAQTPSSIGFKVSGSPNHPILNTGTGSLLNYDLANDRIDFAVGSTGTYDSPFFCFDFSGSASGVTLNATDANGHVVMDAVGLSSDLTFDLAGDVISMSPSNSVQCFFKSANDETFGPFGKVASGSRDSVSDLLPCSHPDVGAQDDCRFFDDDFADFPKLDIQFTDLRINSPDLIEGVSLDGAAVSPGDLLTYNLVIRNTGDGASESVSFQEVFPAGGNFDAALSDGDWICTDMVETGTGSCPESFGTDPIRFQDVTLPPGAHLVFEINREVEVGSEGQINLFAGLVNGAGTQAESAVAEVALGIVGEAVGIQFLNQPDDTELGAAIKDANDNDIVVQIVDENGNHVSSYQSGGIRMELYQNQSWVADLTTRLAVTDGEVVFTNLTTDVTGVVDGTGYHLYADHNDLNAADESSNFEVTPASAP